MRAIERHGGGQVLERAFTGFDALPAPKTFWQVLGLEKIPRANITRATVENAYRALAQTHHPDKPGGDHVRMSELNSARDAALKELGVRV
jgi:hypothetical protein